MSETIVLPPPSTPWFFDGYMGNENYEVSPTPPETSTSHETGLSNGVVITMIVFSITIIVSILLCFFIRFLASRCAREREADEETGRSSSSRALSSRRVRVRPVDEEVQRPDPTREVNNALPVVKVKSARFGDGKNESVSGSDCPICLSKFEPKEHLRLLPICCHAFHAECVDLWLESNQSCPLCRSPIFASESEILQKVLTASTQQQSDPEPVTTPTQSSNRTGTLVRAESENKMDHDTGANRSWLRDYMETLSSRTASFRSSTRYFTGSSRRTEVMPGDGYWDIEASRAGEEISEMFRWFSAI